MEQEFQELEQPPVSGDPKPGDPPTKLAPVTPLSQFAQQINQGLKPTTPIVSDSFVQSQQVPVVNTTSSRDLTSYRPYLDNPDPNDPNLDVKRANAQSGLEQLGHTAGQFTIGLVGGFLQALGTNLDVKQSIDTLTNTQQEYGNMLTQAGDSITKWGQDKMPIYETNPGEFNPSDPAWWYNKVAQAGPMVGMAGEALAETAAITAATEGTGLPEALGELGEKLGSLGTMKKLVGLGTNTERLKASATMFGLINRHNMSMMSASQAGDEEYNLLMSKYHDENIARQGAAKAASATYLSQMPLVVLDILGFKAMTFNPITSAAEGGLADQMVDAAFGHIANPTLKTAAILGAEATKGAFEGSWMNLSSDYGKYLADRLVNPKADNQKGEQLNDYIKASQVGDVAASGFIGGLITGGLFKGYENMTQGSAKNAMAEQYKTFVDGMASGTSELVDAIKKASGEGNELEANNLRRQLGTYKALTAVHLDQLQGETAAFGGYKSMLQSTLDTANSSDPEALKNIGLEGQGDFLKRNIPQYLQDADHIKSIYDDVKEHNKADLVPPIVHSRFTLDVLNDHLKDVNQRVVATEAGMKDLSNLSPYGNDLFEHQVNIQAKTQKLNEINQELKDFSLSDEKRQSLEEVKNSLNYDIAFSQTKIDPINDTRTPNQKATDNDIFNTVDSGKYSKLIQEKTDVQDAIDQTRKALAIQQDPKYQAKKTQAKIADVINKTSSVSEIEKAAQALDSQNLLTPEVTQALIEKKKTIQAKDETESLKNRAPETTATLFGIPQSPLSSFIQAKAKQPEPTTELPKQNTTSPFGTPIAPKAEDIQNIPLSDERKNISKDVFSQGSITKVEPKVEQKTHIKTNDYEISNIKNADGQYGVIASTSQGNGTYIAHNALSDYFNTKEEADEHFNKVNQILSTKYNKPTINATIVEDDGAYFDPAPLNEDVLTNERKEQIKTKIGDYIKSLKSDLGKEPDFRDLAEDFINHTSKDQVDRNWNLLKLGWELNGNKADYDKIYTELFGDRKALGLSFFDENNDIVTESKELDEVNQDLSQKQISGQADPEEKDITESGFQILKPLKGLLRTVSSTLKFAHLSLPYIRKVTTTEEGHLLAEYQNLGDQINQPEYIDSRQLMNPNKWAEGTKGHIQVAENANDMLVSTWNKDWTNGKPIKFSEWAEGKDPNSDEYIGKLPMTIHGEDGNPVALAHDMEWYNPINIGYADDPKQQASIIAAAKAELIEMRKEVLRRDGKLDIQVTEKKPGTKYLIPEGKPLKTISETDPEIKIGYANQLGNIQYKDGIINADSLINKQDMKSGFKYELRQAGVDENKEPIYYANRLLYPKIDLDAKKSIYNALRVYAFQNDVRTDDVSVKQQESLKQVQKQVLEQTGLDLRSPQDLQRYLNLFIATENTNVGNGTGEELASRVSNAINSNPNLLNGETPFLSLQKGGIYFGIKGVKIDGSNEVNYFYPGLVGKGSKDPDKAASMINSFLVRMTKDDFLGRMTQNMDGKGVQQDTPVSHITYDNDKLNVLPQSNYSDYLKNRLQTNLQSFDLGDEGKATFVQPVINFTYDKAKEEIKNNPIETPKALDVINKVAEQVGERLGVDDQSKLIDEVVSNLNLYKSLGWSDEAIKAIEALKPNNSKDNPDFDPDYKTLTDEVVKNIKTKLIRIDNLDTTDRGNMVQFIATEIMSKINPGESINKKELITEVKKTFDDLINPKVEASQKALEAFNKLIENYPGLKPSIDAANTTISDAKVLNDNWHLLVNEASEIHLERFTGISLKMNKKQDNVDIDLDSNNPEEVKELKERENEKEENIDPDNQRDKNYSKESVEDNFQDSIGYQMKRFFASIPAYDKLGNQKTGFMGVPIYPGFDEYSKAVGSMLSSRGPVVSDYEDMKTRLTAYAEAHPFVNEVVKRLDAGDQQLRNAFMYNFTRDNLTMKFVMSSFNTKTKNYQLKVYDTNSNEILRVIQTQWRNNFNQSSLVNSDYEINQIKAQNLLDTYNNWIKIGHLPTEKEAKGFLNEFGITLAPDALKEIMTKGYYVSEGKGSSLLPYGNKQGKPTDITQFGSKGLFGFLANKLNLMVGETTNKDYTENDNLNPFEDSRDIMKKVSNIEAKYSTHLTTNSFRDDDKTVFGFTPGKYATALVFKIKTDPKVMADKQQISFDKHSFILNLLATDQDFRDKFNIDHIGITAFKVLGKKNYGSNRLNTLSDADAELTRLGEFQDKQGEVKSLTPEGLSLRIARMFSPTMSDKSGMFDFTTAVLDLKSKDFSDNKPNDKVIDFAFSQLVTPELQRIVSHYDRAFKNQTDPNFLTNEKGYNLAAQIFNLIPRMNTLDYIQENGEKTKLLDFLAHSGGNIDSDVFNKIVDKIKPAASDILKEIFDENVKNKLNLWEKNGYIQRGENGEVSKISFLDHQYISDRPGTNEEKLNVAANDYVINSMIHEANMHMLLAGDIANYSQDKLFKGKFETDENGNPITWKPLKDSAYSDLSQGIGTNLGKRLALLNAPGNTIAQSKGDKYLQLFAKDRVSPTENLGFLIGLYHGKQAEKDAQPYINILKISKNPTEVNNITNKLVKQYPDLAQYLSIESTDAQEYITAKEHTDILFRQGRMSDIDYQRINKILMAQRAAEKKQGFVPQDLFLTPQDVNLLTDPLIYQPQKPVVTGQMNDVDNDMSRMIYIKSAAFPLIPQITQAYPEMNEVRKGMEDVQEKFGKNVRMSYDTANKVGAPLSSKQLQIWDNEGKYIPGAINAEKLYSDMLNNIPTHAMMMDRENFRIQQDVPYRPEHQTETFGTQMMKEIFGDGISQIQDKVFNHNGVMKSGKDLSDEVNQHIDGWLRNEKSNLYHQLGIDENTGQPIDKMKSIQKLQSLLQSEAKKRGYPQQDIDALEVSPIYEEDGKTVKDAQFTIPLWLSPNSNRYEALLNAVVTSRLVDMKLPGAAYVVGSEEGFRSGTAEDQKAHENRTIFTSKWNGSLQPARYDEKGEFQRPQVLRASRFRNPDGSLLDLFKKGENGKELYIHKDEQGNWRLNEDMIDDEMKSNTAFRIPTSYHQSMSQDETVGYLPPEAGNLRIDPKNFTKQKGQDFDVDTSHTYELWHTITPEGKIIPIEKDGVDLSNIDETHQGIKDIIAQFQSTLDKNSEINKMIDQYKDEIAVSDEQGFDPADAKKFISQLKKDINFTIKKGDVRDLVNYEKYLRDLKSKLYQNEVIKAYSSILGSGDERVQQKINKVLSTDFAESQADLLDKLTNEGVDSKNFTVLSDQYQKDKMSAGAVGKMAIGVYANYSVFHALVQQSELPIQLMTKDDEGKTIPYNLIIGDIPSDGKLGKSMTLTKDGKDGDRNVASIIGGEALNTGTDNEKLRTLDRTGINGTTINVHALLASLAYDKTSSKAEIPGYFEKQEISIPYFLLSQPIIKDYVSEMANIKSNIAEYKPNAEAEVIDQLNKKYSNNGEFNILDNKQIAEERAKLTGQKLVDNILDKGSDGVSQQAILHLFNEVKYYADKVLTPTQSKLNIQRNGLGKSIFEMLEKYNNVALLANNDRISNLGNLVGHYITDLSNQDLNSLREQGYSLFNLGGMGDSLPFAVKPTTATGSLIIHSAKSGYELWSKYFPHSNELIKKTINDIISMTSSENISESKKLDMQYEIFSEMKKYLYSSSSTGRDLFKGNPQDERERLFMDKEGKESLASYLNKYIRSNDPNASLVRDNKLINKFQYQLEKGKLPSIIKYDNSKSEDFNEEYKYHALVELMDKNAKIADFQGQPYTTRMLAKDLINSAFLEGGIQEAIQYIKYVPIAYLKEMGFADKTQDWQRAANGELFGPDRNIDLWQKMLGTSSDDLQTTEYPRFTQQYFQHNPGRLQKLTIDNIDTKNIEYTEGKQNKLENLEKFRPKGIDNPKPYISIYNRDIKMKNKNQIYKWDGEFYNRIPNLGAFGMSEYSIRDNNVRPLIDNARDPISASINSIPQQDAHIQASFFDLDKGHLGNTLKSIEDSELPGFSDTAKLVSPYLPADLKLIIGDVNSNRARGQYFNKEITISKSFLDNPNTTKEDIARTILHEYIHGLTSDYLSKFFDKKTGALLIDEDKLPVDIKRINRLYREVEKNLGPELQEFRDWYSSNSDKGTIRDQSDRALYAGMNVHEFTAMIMSEPDIQARMAEIQYKESGKTLLQHFFDSIKKVLNSLGIKFDEDSVTAKSMDSILSLLDNQKKESEATNAYLSPFGKTYDPSGDEDLGRILDKLEPGRDQDTPDINNEKIDPEKDFQPDCIF